MAWSNSKIFRITLANALGNVTALDLDADSFKLANYNNSITPDQNATAANVAYNAGQWASANEISQGGQWAAGGIAIGGTVLDTSTNGIVMFDGNDVASGSAATLSNVNGGLVYDDTLTTPVADQGLCYLYYGGAASVTNGTLTVQFAATGICRWDLTV
jgi:hypothetical protein